MNVFGLDLSITASGFAPSGDFAETVGGPAQDGDGRLVAIRNRVRYWLRRTTYDLAVVEQLAFGGQTETLAMVHGVVRAELYTAEVPYALVLPSTLKVFATGNGAATKAEMVQTAEGMAGRKFHDDNQADAAWLRRMGLAALGDRNGLTPRQITSLYAVKWPHPVNPFADLGSLKGQVAQCRHKAWCLRNGDHWLHPFTLDRCDKPPK